MIRNIVSGDEDRVKVAWEARGRLDGRLRKAGMVLDDHLTGYADRLVASGHLVDVDDVTTGTYVTRGGASRTASMVEVAAVIDRRLMYRRVNLRPREILLPKSKGTFARLHSLALEAKICCNDC